MANPVQGGIGKVITVEDLERIFGQVTTQGGQRFLLTLDPKDREIQEENNKLLKTIIAHLEIMNGDVISPDQVELT